MSVPDFAHGIQTSFLDTMAHAKAAQIRAVQITPARNDPAAGPSFADNLIDIVNPLQHIPIVSTAYRAITGDKISDGAKIIGGGLYGGLIGLGSSMADVAFKNMTGKDFGDTVLSMFEGGEDTSVAVASAEPAAKPDSVATAAPTSLASAKPAPVTPAPVTPAQATSVSGLDTTALMDALTRSGVDSDLSLRALSAYRQSVGMGQVSADAEANH
jgi:hypothetical protein